MCIIVSRPAGKHVKFRYLKASWEANDDGAGIMFTHNNKVHIVKGLMTFQDFIKSWKEIPEELPAVAHFRIRTHGHADAENTHPFEVIPGRLAIAHNGILPILPPKDSTMSDTATFVEYVLKKLSPGWHRSPAMLHLLDQYCGTTNKLAIMDQTGKVTLINEDAGTWEEGVWYSNQSFRGWQSYRRTAKGTYRYTGYDSDYDDEYIDLGATYPIPGGGAGVGSPALQSNGVQNSPAGAASGTDKKPTDEHDALLDSSVVELDLRRQGREARAAGRAVEADKLESAANAIRDERIATIRDRTRAELGLDSRGDYRGTAPGLRPYGGD